MKRQLKRWLLGPLCCCVALAVLSACGQKPTRPSALTWQEQYDLGIRYLEEGNYEEAIIAFAAAIEIDPKQAVVYEKLADTYLALGDDESARKALEDGCAATGDEALQQKLDEWDPAAEAENTVTSDDGAVEVAASGSVLTVSLTDPNLRESYPINRVETEDDMLEYAWFVRFTDGKNTYEVGTSHFKFPGSPPDTISLYEMQSDVWLINDDSSGDSDGAANAIGDAELAVSGTTMTWSFTVPEEYGFDPSAMQITEHIIEMLA